MLFPIGLQVNKLQYKFVKYSDAVRPIEDELVKYEAYLDHTQPFGLEIQDGKDAAKKVSEILREVEKTSMKTESVDRIANETVEQLTVYDAETWPVASQVSSRQKQIEEIKEQLETRKQNVDSNVKELDEFLVDLDTQTKWSETVLEEVEKLKTVGEEPEDVKKHLQDVEVCYVV